MRTYKELPSDAGSNIIGQVTAQANRLQKRLASVKHTVAIMSGKGGVGKSSLTANLATALTLKGNTVGVVDADINGPTLAKMMGVRDATLEYTPAGVKPAMTALGTKLISMDLLLAEDDAPVLWNAHTQKDAFTWRTTMEVGALRRGNVGLSPVGFASRYRSTSKRGGAYPGSWWCRRGDNPV